MRQPIVLGGLKPDEVLALSDEDLNAFVLCGEPLVFHAGTADILGRFWVAIPGGEGWPLWTGAFTHLPAPTPT
jgi:hypothetical protein